MKAAQVIDQQVRLLVKTDQQSLDTEMAELKKNRVRRAVDEKLARLQGVPTSKKRASDLNSKGVLFDDGEDDALDFLERSPETFRANLQHIFETFGVEVGRVAREAGVEYRWLRRAATKGLERRVPRLDRLAHHFGLPDGHYFWAEDITKFLKAAPPRPEALKNWKQSLNWQYAERLLELLETDEHDFLKALINSLHGSLVPQATTEVHEGRRSDAPKRQIVADPVQEDHSGKWDVQPDAAAFCMPEPKRTRKRRDRG